MFKTYTILFLLLALTATAFSQFQITNISTYNTGDGLGSGSIRCIDQDPITGNFWFTGPNEIFYMEQDTFKHFDFLDNFYQSVETQMDVSIDGYLAYHFSDSIYIIKGGLSEKFYAPTGNYRCYDVLWDVHGNCWFAFYDGLAKYNGLSIDFYTTTNGLPDNYVTCIFEDSFERLWFGFPEGVAIYDGSYWVFKNAPWDTLNNGVNAIGEDADGFIWMGGRHIAYYDGNGFIPMHPPTLLGVPDSLSSIVTINTDNQDRLWFGTHDHGLFYRDGTDWFRYTSTDGLVSDQLRCSFKDSQDKLWFGFYVHGTSNIYNNIWTNYSTGFGLADNRVEYIYRDQSGKMWFTTRDGLSMWNGGWQTYFTGSNNDAGYCIKDDASGKLTTFGSKMFRMENNQWDTIDAYSSFSYDFISPGPDEYWRTSALGVWHATGPNYTDASDWIRYSTIDGLPHNKSRTVEMDSSGVIWVGTYNGLATFNGTGFTDVAIPSTTFGPRINDIRTGLDGEMWFASSNGVAKFDGTNWEFFYQSDGLIHDFTYRLEIASDSTIWIASRGGVTIITDTGLVSLDKADGLIHEHCRCIEQDSDGNMWVGTWHGVSVIEEVIDTSTLSLVKYIEDDLLVYPNPASETLSIEVEHLQNNARIEIYSLAGHTVYSGFLKSERTNLNVSGIKPGSYFIRIVNGQDIKTSKVILMD
jgi:hypothetical protein